MENKPTLLCKRHDVDLVHKDISCSLDVKKISQSGKFSGYASRFNEPDDGLDIVRPGAFTKTLEKINAKGQIIPCLWQHDSWKPIGTWPVIKEDSSGLYVEGQIETSVQFGKDTVALMKSGAISGLSIGYRVVKGDYLSNGLRELIELELFEISIVTFPMLDSARVDAVKSSEMDLRSLKTALTVRGISIDLRSLT